MKIYNTLTRAKEEFAPLRHGEVRMYVCGVTVYDLCHIGHARSTLVFDVIRRYLEFKGYRVTYVRNFTDVDDKIIRRAQQEGVPSLEISERYIEEFRRDMAAIGVRAADVEPKATDHIPQMIALIERLVAGGFAYVVDGDVYFEIRRFPSYGRLSGKNLDELLAGARVEVDERKRDPRDFALWKTAKPGEPSWASSWGPGRPGWHVECSAMAMQYLGESFDIHGGGEDLVFPHHECEIAQAEASTKKPFVRYWIHNAFVNTGAEKMSKSLGNTLAIREIVKRHNPDALRLWMLGTHYRHPIEWSEERAAEAHRALDRFRRLFDEASPAALRGVKEFLARTKGELTEPEAAAHLLAGLEDRQLAGELTGCYTRFVESMDDDFNTAQALGALFDLSYALYQYRDAVSRGDVGTRSLVEGTYVLFLLCRVVGLLEGWYERSVLSPELQQEIESLVAQRDEARKHRDWKRADEIRSKLQGRGVSIEDTPAGTKWRLRSGV